MEGITDSAVTLNSGTKNGKAEPTKIGCTTAAVRLLAAQPADEPAKIVSKQSIRGDAYAASGTVRLASLSTSTRGHGGFAVLVVRPEGSA